MQLAAGTTEIRNSDYEDNNMQFDIIPGFTRASCKKRRIVIIGAKTSELEPVESGRTVRN
jgi:hypothetical protein